VFVVHIVHSNFLSVTFVTTILILLLPEHLRMALVRYRLSDPCLYKLFSLFWATVLALQFSVLAFGTSCTYMQDKIWIWRQPIYRETEILTPVARNITDFYDTTPCILADACLHLPSRKDVRDLRNAANIYQIIRRRTPEDSNLQLIKPSKVLQSSSFRNTSNNRNYIREVMSLSSGNACGKIKNESKISIDASLSSS
jgi:hypothetical protein